MTRSVRYVDLLLRYLPPRLLAALVIAGIGLAGCGSALTGQTRPACPGETPVRAPDGSWVCDPDAPASPSPSRLRSTVAPHAVPGRQTKPKPSRKTGDPQ
jgi:hypothetical protein